MLGIILAVSLMPADNAFIDFVRSNATTAYIVPTVGAGLVGLLVWEGVKANDIGKPQDNDPDRWRLHNTVMEGLLVLEALYDITSTNYCLSKGICAEADPVLVRNGPAYGTSVQPDKFRLYMTGALVIGLHTLVARALPEPYRSVWQSAVIGLEFGNLTGNVYPNGGFSIKF